MRPRWFNRISVVHALILTLVSSACAPVPMADGGTSPDSTKATAGADPSSQARAADSALVSADPASASKSAAAETTVATKSSVATVSHPVSTFDGAVQRTFDVRQTATIAGIQPGTRLVKMWIAIPDDVPGQKVLDLDVVDFPGTWSLASDESFGNRFIYAEIPNPAPGNVSLAVDYSVRRDLVALEIDPAKTRPLTDDDRKLFAEELRKDVPLMKVTPEIEKLALEVCGTETNPAIQAKKIFEHVADFADHYSKDPSKPHCGRGAAEDCLAQMGGCCTDLHSLFISLARARGIPARLEFGLRLNPKNEGIEYDPGYRCWVDYFIPGYGWIPTDVVAGDSGGRPEREAYTSGLDARRLWLCRGRDFDLTPKQTGARINTMIIGHAEIDGKRVPVLPLLDGTPSPFTRKVRFTERKPETTPAVASN
jgi:transglutaminase-like putative cysteine protease